ncbi:MAG: hypothetical protein GX811_11480 [Lentisphaerae bacterium]|nr:hypothetical protein [Lentisphaerota bacterium]
MLQHCDDHVEQIVWNWQKKPVDAPSKLKPLVRSLIGSLIGSILLLVGFTVLGSIAMGIALLTLVTTLFFPKLNNRINNGIDKLAYGVGLCFSWILLTPVFYLIFGGSRFILLLLRKEALYGQRIDRKLKSYWIPFFRRSSNIFYRNQF